jgi:hypothetical protein
LGEVQFNVTALEINSIAAARECGNGDEKQKELDLFHFYEATHVFLYSQ